MIADAEAIRSAIARSIMEVHRVGYAGPAAVDVVAAALYATAPHRWGDLDTATRAVVEVMGTDPRVEKTAS